MPNPSILLVGVFASQTGSNHGQGEDLARRLQDIGWSVLTTSSAVARSRRITEMLFTAWRHRSEYELAQVDVYSGKAFIWAELVCFVLRRIGKPYVLVLRGGNLPEFARRHGRRVRRLLGSARSIITPSPYLSEHMETYCRAIEVIPNALDLERYPFRMRTRFDPRLMWIRGFHEIYNPTLAVEVVRRLEHQFPSVTLAMVGPDRGDGSRQRTVEHAHEVGVFQRVSFLGGVPKRDVPLWLDKGDIFLNTTSVDNTPVTVIEAMACGLGIVSTDVGGIRYLLEHNVNALLTPSDDAEAMAAAVKKVISSPDIGRHLAENAREKVRSMDWNVVMPRWVGCFKAAQ